MRKLIGVLLIVLGCVAAVGAQKTRYGQQPEPTKPVPPDYAISIHVRASHFRSECIVNNCSDYLYIDVVIDGTKYELKAVGPNTPGLLKPGDYSAKVLSGAVRSDGLFRQEYSLLLKDNSTLKCTVTGVSE